MPQAITQPSLLGQTQWGQDGDASAGGEQDGVAREPKAGSWAGRQQGTSVNSKL